MNLKDISFDNNFPRNIIEVINNNNLNDIKCCKDLVNIIVSYCKPDHINIINNDTYMTKSEYIFKSKTLILIV